MGVEVHNAIGPLEREWDALADRTAAAPWLRPGWIAAWWDLFGVGRLEILAVRRDGGLRALVAVRRRRGDVLSPVDWHTPEFGVLAEDRAAAAELAACLFARGGHRIELRQVRRDDLGLEACRNAAGSRGYRTLDRTLQRAPFVAIDRDWAAYERSRDRDMLRNVQRRRRRLDELGTVSIEFRDAWPTPEELDRCLEEGYQVEAMGWKGRRKVAIASDERSRRFFTTLAHWAAERGWLRLSYLRLNGRPLAFQLNLEEAGVGWGMKMGYDPTVDRASPGTLLLHAELERAFASGLSRYEFLGPDQPYKLEWATGTRDVQLLQAFAPGVVGEAERLAFKYARPVARRVLRRWRH